MFDRISPNHRIVGSKFDQEPMVGFQMSLPSGILSSKSWKFVRWFFALPKREVLPCLRLACVASICSKLQERASLAGFLVGKQGTSGPSGNPSVARWKNNSYYISNIILS